MRLSTINAARQMGDSKACPVILRSGPLGRTQILAFLHPIAGKQLVKGTVQEGESVEHAALRELEEESGIANARATAVLGSFEILERHQTWHAVLCHAVSLPESWVFRTQDDGGHDFQFFWHDLDDPADEQWHASFRQALIQIHAWVQDVDLGA